jgi:hypothetical protein
MPARVDFAKPSLGPVSSPGTKNDPTSRRKPANLPSAKQGLIRYPWSNFLLTIQLNSPPRVPQNARSFNLGESSVDPSLNPGLNSH